MRRSISAFLCVAAAFFVAGCDYKVKETEPVKTGETPKMSEEDRQKVLDDQKKLDEAAAKRKKEIEGKASGKERGKKDK